ncbi:MAG: hypothetical protein IT422_27915 [Pirellulaceae bacterium]|jgi:hypothetical protein|nr:hypothetical protein [Pirellulaceae bacterium]
MAKHSKFTFPLSALFLAIAPIALLFSRGLSFWFVLLIAELFAIYACVELLTKRMPAALRTQSKANCYRLDGTRSHRRSSRERRSLRKIRSDLWAVFLIVAFIETGGVFFIHTQVFPLSLATEVVSALRDDPADFKGALRQRNIDDKFFRWSRSSSTSSIHDIDQQARLLWMVWPVILLLVIATLVACVALIRYAYLRTLREFHQAVTKRATEYLNLDTSRLQE